MVIETSRFGPIEVPEEAVIHFPRGLYGLDTARRFCLIQHDDLGQFQWLQATDEPTIAMVVTDPFLHFPGYEVEIPDPAAELLQAEESTDVAIYTTITVARERQEVSTNLLGPLAINLRTGLGVQLVLDGSRYTTRHVIAGPAASDGECRHAGPESAAAR